MEKQIKLKYGTIVFVLSIINVVLLAVIGLGFIFLNGFIQMIINVELESTSDLLNTVFNIMGLVIALMAVFVLFAGFKAQYSKGWNIAIVVICGFILLTYSISSFELFTMALYGSLLLFAILNIIDASKLESSTYKDKSGNDLESKLNRLNALFDKGLISQEEYQASRQEAIRKIE
ncbi:SHOCT domain-containing protein [Acholeplasma laidlawii]|uniref:SHOCT domain-containing protein n=1 Tax=Acholeplasma laidlawii TaxID=2148 RepID=UPI0025409A0D|nr:SHOCT domain-containing protein [Acholeplasma laidlawii]